MTKHSGVLLHIASLPGKYGIGSLGKEAHDFVDFLARSGQSLWQVLPLVPTGYGDSPYQSACTTAGSEYFIDLEYLVKDGLLSKSEIKPFETSPDSRIDYENLFNTRFEILHKAFDRFDTEDKSFASFLRRGEYSDYALFRAIKETQGHRAWSTWEEGLKFRDKRTIAAFKRTHKRDILFWQWAQFTFFKQWQSLKSYANKKNIKLVGDMPIYVAYDSVECWTHPEMVKLDENLNPTVVAGCPPDAFSETGQLWGNPVYDWEYMKADGYYWWKARLKKCFEIYDIVRIDHFRGFDRYWEIPFGDKTAKGGKWVDGPSSAIFEEIERSCGKMDVIAEDLGILDDSAREMFAKVGYPGMKVLQFAFDSGDGNEYLPHNYKSDNCVVYTGTHDNDTLMGYIGMLGDRKEWFVSEVRAELERMKLSFKVESDEDVCDAIIALGMASKAKICIIPMQDWLKIGGEGRINLPGTLSTENWSYRIPQKYNDPALAIKMREITSAYGRSHTIDDN